MKRKLVVRACSVRYNIPGDPRAISCSMLGPFSASSLPSLPLPGPEKPSCLGLRQGFHSMKGSSSSNIAQNPTLTSKATRLYRTFTLWGLCLGLGLSV